MKTTTFSRNHADADIAGGRDQLHDPQMRAFVSQLKSFLCHTYSLLVQTQGCHWNYTGPDFAGMHKLLEKQYEEIFEAIDPLAERLRALNVYAPVSLNEINEIASKRDLSDFDSSLNDLVDRLIISHKVLQKDLEELIERAEHCKDSVTEDLLIKRKEFHDKALWMLNATRQPSLIM